MFAVVTSLSTNVNDIKLSHHAFKPCIIIPVQAFTKLTAKFAVKHLNYGTLI